MADQTETVDHLELLRLSLPAIFRNVARTPGVVDPVVVVLDLRDDDARRLAGPPGREDQVAARLAAGARTGAVPVATVVASRTEARDRIAAVCPEWPPRSTEPAAAGARSWWWWRAGPRRCTR